MENEILDNHKRYLSRKKMYRNFGFDIDKERKSVLKKVMPVSGRILEVGTGKGHFTLALARKGYRFTSVDISEEEQRIARLNLRYFGLEDLVDFRLEDAENLSFKDAAFDFVLSVNTVHHFKNPFKVIDELARVLNLKGRLALSDFNKEGLGVLDKVHLSEGRVHKTAGFSLDDVGAYLEQKAFNTERQAGRFQDVLTAYRRIG